MNHWGINTERIEIRISKEQKAIAQKIAERNNASVGEVFRQALITLIEKEGRYGKKS